MGALNNTNSNVQTNANPALSCEEFTIKLSKGMNNPEVKCLQQMLNAKGFKVTGAGNETTYFGENTLLALKAFQTSNNLVVDGIFGINSFTALKK